MWRKHVISSNLQREIPEKTARKKSLREFLAPCEPALPHRDATQSKVEGALEMTLIT